MPCASHSVHTTREGKRGSARSLIRKPLELKLEMFSAKITNCRLQQTLKTLSDIDVQAAGQS